MDIRECYDLLGGSYDNVLARFISEERVKKFLLRFPEDKTFCELAAAVDHLDYTTAFRCAHTLKGICANLGFDRLCASSSTLTELLRDKTAENADVRAINTLWESVALDYKSITDAIKKYAEAQS